MRGTSCCLSPEKLRATKEAPRVMASNTGSMGGWKLVSPFFALVPTSAAADRVAELAEPDRQRIAIVGNADVSELSVGGVGTGRDGWHPAVHGVEAVTAADEVSRGVGGAADAGKFHDVLRLQRLG